MQKSITRWFTDEEIKEYGEKGCVSFTKEAAVNDIFRNLSNMFKNNETPISPCDIHTVLAVIRNYIMNAPSNSPNVKVFIKYIKENDTSLEITIVYSFDIFNS